MPGEQERHAHHDREVRDPLGEEGRVERGRQRRLGHPHVAEAVLDRAAVRRLRRQRLVARVAAVRRQEAAHLGIPLALGRLERVVLHDVGERARLGAGRDRLAGLELAVRQLGGVVSGDDLLRRDLVAHRR